MCDVSDYVVGVVLGQRIDKKPYVIYYASHTLNEVQVNYTVTKKEFLAAVLGFEKFITYLIASYVIVFTNHATLKDLIKKKDARPRLIKWITLFQEFDFETEDREGSKNPIAYHLSRIMTRNASESLICDHSPMSDYSGLI